MQLPCEYVYYHITGKKHTGKSYSNIAIFVIFCEWSAKYEITVFKANQGFSVDKWS